MATSSFGNWDFEHGLPVFRELVHPDSEVCRWDPVVEPPTHRHWCGMGNRRFQIFAENTGTTSIWDTANGFRWLTAAEPGTGASIVTPAKGDQWATDSARWPTGDDTPVPVRTWGPTWFSVSVSHEGIAIERTVFSPEGDAPWVLVRVEVHADEAQTIELAEEWHLSPRGIARGIDRDSVRALTAQVVSFDETIDESGVTLVEKRDPSVEIAPEMEMAFAGPTTTLRLESRNPLDRVETDGGDHPTVRLVRTIEVDPDQPSVSWFALGLPDEQQLPDDLDRVWTESLSALRDRLPTASCDRIPVLEREVPWHTALLTGAACTDAVIGEHTLDQASAYSFHFGFNGAARDPLQHAMPLVYIDPDLALSVLRNTCSWGDPNGELPWALDAAKKPMTDWYEPSDQALWSMWLAAEYAAVTGDLDAFRAPLGFHPVYDAEPVPLVEHLVRQFRHLIDVVGVGSHGHIRILNADWNDSALTLSGVERTLMQEQGESILNSAMAAWVLPRFAGLLRRIGDPALEPVAVEAEERAAQWRELVAGEWNGRWYRRAYGPGAVVGDDDMWLEVQPWAILCGAADDDRSRALLATIDELVRQDSPLGARIRGPLPIAVPEGRDGGEGTAGGVWFSINMTLAWAAASLDPDLAWDELSKMTLAAHTEAYPAVWEGTLSGPDAYNTPESPRPGHTWAWAPAGRGMQSFPINNLHAHAQVLFTYLRVMGVEPTTDGALRTGGGGGRFSSPVFELDGEGHGWLLAKGPVRLVASSGEVEGSGRVTW